MRKLTMTSAAICGSLFLTLSEVKAATFTETFYSDNTVHQFTYRTDKVAVHASSIDSTLSSEPILGIHGIRLINASDAKSLDKSALVGFPVELGEKRIPAVLTAKVLIGIDYDFKLVGIKGAISVETPPYAPSVRVIGAADPQTAISIANELYGKAGVRYAHPNFLLPIETRNDPANEPFFNTQWNLEKINIRAAWQETTGNPETLVAVIDLGFEQAHSDLQEAWMINSKEIPGNRIDDDGNGLKDDVSGWNFAINGTNLIYGQNPAHGTASSGIISARANGAGVTGICPRCRILPIVIDAEVQNAVLGFFYAKSFGAHVISNSWGYQVGTPRMDAVVDAINQTAASGREGKGTSIVFAMSNFGRNDCRQPTPDISSLDSVIAVSSVDMNDHKVETSAFGPCMEFVAPTSGSTANAIPTTDRPGAKGYNTGSNDDDFLDLDYTKTFYGTSAATPQVAGVLALLYSLDPNLNSNQALAALKAGIDKVQPEHANYDSNGHSALYGFGRINAGQTVSLFKNR